MSDIFKKVDNSGLSVLVDDDGYVKIEYDKIYVKVDYDSEIKGEIYSLNLNTMTIDSVYVSKELSEDEVMELSNRLYKLVRGLGESELYEVYVK